MFKSAQDSYKNSMKKVKKSFSFSTGDKGLLEIKIKWPTMHKLNNNNSKMSSNYSQAAPKRQKMKEIKEDYFQGIDRLEYSSSATHDCLNFKYYSSNERLHGKTMEEWLKFSVSFTDFKYNGADDYGRATFKRPWDDQTNSLEQRKKSIKACFDFCLKTGVKYWTAFDSDLLPLDNGEEKRGCWDEIVEFIQENVNRTHVRPLWIAPDLHSNSRYASGAFTNPDSTTFLQAATQIKKCLEVSQKLNTEVFLLWPYREGYDNIFKTDVNKELKLFAKLLKITAEYKEKLNFRCQLILMPFYDMGERRCKKSDKLNTYIWDVTSCLYLLKSYNLERFYKVCVEPGHQMVMANLYNMLGGVFITNDMDYCNYKKFTLMMKTILDQGSTPISGINLRLSPRRDSLELRDLISTYVKFMDLAARGLRVAVNNIQQQSFNNYLQNRYSSYTSGHGSRLLNGEVTMDECEDYDRKYQTHRPEQSTSKSEFLDLLLQRSMDIEHNI